MANATNLLCGCPADADEHQPDCWMGKAENIANAAITAHDARPRPGGRTTAVVHALATAGYLRELTDEQSVWTLLDTLTEAGLLGAPGSA